MGDETEEKKLCVRCGVKEGTIGITDLNHPTRIEGKTTVYEPTSFCWDCFMFLKFGPEGNKKE